MSSDAEVPDWAAAEPYLDQVLELEPHQQEAWLRNLDSTAPEIARTVRNLLAQRDALNAAGFMGDVQQSFFAIEALGLKAGAMVGPYRLIREIGHGGMSSVWLAGRADGQLKREVALKLPYIDARMHVDRFLRERDILAALTHSQIARLYDAGISESGQPYLAMEYVEGAALLHHCDERRLTINERLRLFLQVLDAVQFAHAQLIIHRDLKPSNILVTPQGRATLLDFGIGKLLIDGTAPATHLTQLAGRAFTPDYASPEQIGGQSLGTASDIYSLGVILFEMLTGARPYRPKRDSRAALEEAILADDPRRPSQADISAEAAAARGATLRVLTRSLAGDLDTIVLKALKKSPQQRYASVTAFAQDIINHLYNLPVSARPDRYWYRAGRFVSRHKIPVVAASVSVLALLGGAGLAIWHAQVAAQERDRALAFAARNEAVTEFLGTIIKEAAESSKPITVSEMLARSEQLALQDNGDIPENRAAVLELIGDQYFAAGDSQRSARIAERALALVAQSSDRTLRSRLRCNYAHLQSELGLTTEAITAIQNELRNLDSDPQTATICLLNLTEIYWISRTPQEALRYAQEALARYEQIPHPRGWIGTLLPEVVAYTYHLNGDNSKANEYFERALAKYKETGGERRPAAVTMRGTWALVIAKAGMPKRALQLYDEISRIEAEREPGAALPPNLLGNWGRALASVGRFKEARSVFDEVCRRWQELDEALGNLQCALDQGTLALQTGAFAEVAGYLRRADQFLDGDLSPASPVMLRRKEMEGRLELASGHFTQARALFDGMLATKVVSPWTLSAELGKVEIELAARNSDAAVQQAQQALKTASAMQGDLPYSNQTGLASLVLGRAWQSQGDRDQAKTALEAAVAHLSHTVDANHPDLVSAQRLLRSLSEQKYLSSMSGK